MRRRFRMKRRSSRRVHHRRRSFRSRAKGSIWSMAGKVAPGIAFLEQITHKSRSSGDYNGLSMVAKAQQVANNMTGNIFGFNVFGGVKSYSQQINPAGIANKYTGIGVASIVGGLLIRRAGINIPGAGKIFALGRKMLVPGIVGGFFDDSLGNASQNFAGGIVNASGVMGYASGSARPLN